MDQVVLTTTDSLGLQQVASNATDAASAVQDSESLLGSLFSFSSSAGDWVKFAILGALFELARRCLSSLWEAFTAMFIITAYFDGDDDAYTWMMVWLSHQKTWRKARELQVSTRNFTSNRLEGNDWFDVTILSEGQDDSSTRGRILNYLPAFGTTSTFMHNGTLMRVTRDREKVGNNDHRYMEFLSISILGRDHGVLNNLLVEAQKAYKAQEAGRVGVYIADLSNFWKWSGSRPKRPLSSVILEPGIKEQIVDDAKDFLKSEKWYAARGIPYRRGYLLHGAPGSGKTSLIHAIAGTLNLDIYVITLSRKGIDDPSLNELICDLPSRCIAVIEDIDAAFTKGVSRDGMTDSGDEPEDTKSKDSSDDDDSGAGVTLSGLLNAIDGVGAHEGRILIATTNRYHVLDPALIRPGRLDIHVNFSLATSWQAKEVFKCFYPVESEQSEEKEVSKKTSEKEPEVAYRLTVEERDALADKFASAIPDGVASMAAIQGHLMTYKSRPAMAVEGAKAFIEEQIKNAARRKARGAAAKSEAKAEVLDNPEDVPIPETPVTPPDSEDDTSSNGP